MEENDFFWIIKTLIKGESEIPIWETFFFTKESLDLWAFSPATGGVFRKAKSTMNQIPDVY